MAEQKNAKAQGSVSFRRIKKSFNASSGAKRGEPKMSSTPTGVIRSNAEAKDLAVNWVKEQGGDPNNFQFTFGVNEETGQVALYLAKEGDTGTMAVRIYRTSIAFHAGAVFAEAPKLRPVTKVDCPVRAMVDAEGEPCLAVQLAGAAPSRTLKRKTAAAAAK